MSKQVRSNEVAATKKTRFLRFPVISHGAEFLVQGYLMRRNILAYKAPPNNEGYDLICIHPNPRKKKMKSIRVQVKSRYQTDCDRSVIVNSKGLDAFDFLIAVFLNVGNFYRKSGNSRSGGCEPELFTFPAAWVKQHQDKKSLWGKLRLKSLDIERFKGEKGFELIALALDVNYPSRT